MEIKNVQNYDQVTAEKYAYIIPTLCMLRSALFVTFFFSCYLWRVGFVTYAEITVGRCYIKQLFQKVSENSFRNTWGEALFLEKSQATLPDNEPTIIFLSVLWKVETAHCNGAHIAQKWTYLLFQQQVLCFLLYCLQIALWKLWRQSISAPIELKSMEVISISLQILPFRILQRFTWCLNYKIK